MELACGLAGLIREMGHAAEFVTSPRQAVSVAIRSAPDVIFLDLWLPEMDGWHLGTMLRGEPRLSATRIFALTAHATEEDRRRSDLAGLDGHFVKPIDPDFLASLLGIVRR